MKICCRSLWCSHLSGSKFLFTSGILFGECGQTLRNFVGRLLEYDTKPLSRGVRSDLRIKVELDVIMPFKRKKKIMISSTKFIYVNFQYERLTLYCFLCGFLGHNDKFCPIGLNNGGDVMELGWNLNLKAQSRGVIIANSVWLREEGDEKFLETNLTKQNDGINSRDVLRTNS